MGYISLYIILVTLTDYDFFTCIILQYKHFTDDEIIISTLASDQLFKTHAGHFYTCTGKKTYVTYAVDPVTKIPDKNKGKGNMDVSNITVQPFKSLQNMDG